MNAKIITLLGVVLFLSAGCGSKPSDMSEPRATVRTALSAIQDDRLDDFKATLSPELAKTMGDEPSLLKLRVALAAYPELGIGDEMIVNEVPDPNAPGKRRIMRREYSEQVLGSGSDSFYKLLYMANVRCEFQTQTTTNVEKSSEGAPSQQTKEVQVCLLTKLEQ